MKRRALLRLGAGAAAFVLVGHRPTSIVTADAHEGSAAGVPFKLQLADLNPDRMWPVYRRYHLLIVGQRDDERSGALTAAVVDVLSHYLPSSRPQLVSAADARRIGVLIATDQQDVAIMQAESAEALFLAKPPFADIPKAPLKDHRFVRESRSGLPAKFHGPARLSAGEDVGRTCGGPSLRPPSRRAASSRRTGDRTLSSLAKKYRMTDDGLMAGSSRAVTLWKLPRRGGMTLPFLVLVLSVLGLRSPGAHETIDADGVNAILAATDTAAARLKSAAGSAAEGEAMFALGMVQVEATAVLNRDLAAHSGQLTFNGQSLQKALAQRNLAPRLDDAIGRYRLPTASLEQALHLSLAPSDALRARFELLKAGFYESFVLDPFQLVGMSFDDLERQIAEAKSLASVLSIPDDAEEAAFIHAIDLARAARLVREPDAAPPTPAKRARLLGRLPKPIPRACARLPRKSSSRASAARE